LAAQAGLFDFVALTIGQSLQRRADLNAPVTEEPAGEISQLVSFGIEG
jgi:hypothetical protein